MTKKIRFFSVPLYSKANEGFILLCFWSILRSFSSLQGKERKAGKHNGVFSSYGASYLHHHLVKIKHKLKIGHAFIRWLQTRLQINANVVLIN